MKMAFISNQHYMRGVDVTSATIFELGDPLAEGDVLNDIATGDAYEVASRGFGPKRSAETASRSHWSREASVAFRGKCKEIEKRLLFAGDISGLNGLFVTGAVADKTSKIPSGVPIVGLVTLENYDSPGILLADECLRYQLIVAVKSSDEIESKTILFSCLDLVDKPINLTLSVDESSFAVESGPLLNWDEVDREAAMV